MRTSLLSNKDKLKEVALIARNYADILSLLGLHPSSGNYFTLKKYLEIYKIPFEKKSIRREEFIKKTYSDEECFKEGSNISRHHVKKRVIKNNLIPLKCSKCGIGTVWNNKHLVLQLEHINGINNDNRLENLAFICPNCHSQTDTYAARNK